MMLSAFDSPNGLRTCGQWPGLGTDRTGFRSNEHAHADEGICWLGQKLAECDRLALRRLTVTLHPRSNHSLLCCYRAIPLGRALALCTGM